MARQLLEHHPKIGFRFIPGLRARVLHESGGYLVRVNETGFRCDHEFAQRRTPSKRRILLFGDSFTAGDGVSNGARYGDLLEARERNLEVFNFALPGSGTDQQYLAYREFAQDIEHDLLIISVLVENIRRNVARYRYAKDGQGNTVCRQKPYFVLKDGRLILHAVPVSKVDVDERELEPSERAAIDRGGRFPVIGATVNALGIRDTVQRLTRYQPLPEYNSSSDPAWLLMSAILTQWISEHPKPVLVVPLPLYQYVEGTSNATAYQSRFRELQVTTGCHLHDPLTDLLEYPFDQRRRFRFQRDVHLTPRGHEAIATSLGKAVHDVLGDAK